jgi:hypothetical protein
MIGTERKELFRLESGRCLRNSAKFVANEELEDLEADIGNCGDVEFRKFLLIFKNMHEHGSKSKLNFFSAICH